MEKLFLEYPSLARKSQALEYLQEHIEHASNINGTGSMYKCLEGTSYEEWLSEQARRNDFDYAASIGRSPSYTFFLVRQNDDRIVGMINLRYHMSDELVAAGGTHIGYGIRPTERRKGYNKVNLYLGLCAERDLGEDIVYMSCAVSNLGSNGTIAALGGVLDKTEVDVEDSELTNYYHIDVASAIVEYAPAYSQRCAWELNARI